MAPLKFEENIGEKLGAREITPSKKAWDSVAFALEESKPEKKSRFPWYAIAACIIGLLIVSTVYFNSTTDRITDTGVEVVDTPKKQIDKSPLLPDTIETTAIIQEGEDAQLLKKETETKQLPEKRIPKLSKEVIAETGLASSVHKPEEVKDKAMAKAFGENEGVINAKVAEVIAQVSLLEENNTAITDAEVDSLLRIAQKEILTEKLFNEDRTVDAMALLSEVEGELDKSFREQIFEGLKDRFFEVRTALADRNN